MEVIGDFDETRSILETVCSEYAGGLFLLSFLWLTKPALRNPGAIRV